MDEKFSKTLFQSLFLPLKLKEIYFLAEGVSLLGVEEKVQELFSSRVCRLLLCLAERWYTGPWSVMGARGGACLLHAPPDPRAGPEPPEHVLSSGHLHPSFLSPSRISRPLIQLGPSNLISVLRQVPFEPRLLHPIWSLDPASLLACCSAAQSSGKERPAAPLAHLAFHLYASEGTPRAA